jgi:hypothetical protein
VMIAIWLAAVWFFFLAPNHPRFLIRHRVRR